METQLTNTQQGAVVSIDPGALIMAAVEKGLPVETMERLLDMRERIVAERAKVAFYEAMAALQSSAPVIVKDKEVLNKDGRTVRYRYAPMESIIRQMSAIIAANGFSYRFTTEASENTIQVHCHACHALGHIETTSFVSNIDPQAFMNVAQKFGSALTFGKRYAFCNAFGIVTGDDDDDAQSVTESEGMSSAREKLAKLRRQQKQAERQDEGSPPVYHETEQTAEETAEMSLLNDLLASIADATEAVEMDRLLGEVNSLKQKPTRDAAKRGLKARADALGLVYDTTTKGFIRP